MISIYAVPAWPQQTVVGVSALPARNLLMQEQHEWGTWDHIKDPSLLEVAQSY